MLAPARYAAERRIGLVVAPGGFATPDGRLAVRGGDLVVDGVRAPLTTLEDAARQAGVEPGRHTGVHEAATPWRPHEPLAIDARDAAALAAWFALGEGAVGTYGATTLWPEHFDLATTVGEVNVGVSPGDEAHPLPYAYVGPWDPSPVEGPFWNEPWGASLPWSPTLTAHDVRRFVDQGLAAL